MLVVIGLHETLLSSNRLTASHSMVTFANTSNDAIRVEIDGINFDKHVHPNSMLRVSLTFNETYGIKFSKGKNVQKTT